MKHVLFIITILICGLTAQAQPPDFNIDISHHACSDIFIKLYAVEENTCGPVIGETDVIQMAPGANLALPPYNGIWVAGGDPAVNCPNCTWEFMYAEVSSDPACWATPTGTPACGNWDICTVGNNSCGYQEDDCFSYSGACASCVTNDIIYVNYGAGNISVSY